MGKLRYRKIWKCNLHFRKATCSQIFWQLAKAICHMSNLFFVIWVTDIWNDWKNVRRDRSSHPTWLNNGNEIWFKNRKQCYHALKSVVATIYRSVCLCSFVSLAGCTSPSVFLLVRCLFHSWPILNLVFRLCCDEFAYQLITARIGFQIFCSIYKNIYKKRQGIVVINRFS